MKAYHLHPNPETRQFLLIMVLGGLAVVLLANMASICEQLSEWLIPMVYRLAQHFGWPQ